MHAHAPHVVPSSLSPGQADAPSHADAPHAAAASCEQLLRVGQFLQAIAAARAVTDEELRQHAADCNQLLEAAHARFLATGNVHEREDACLWMHRRDDALRILSARGATFVELRR